MNRKPMIACGSLSQKDLKAKTKLKPTLPLPNKRRRRADSPAPQYKKKKRGNKSFTTDNKCMCLQHLTPHSWTAEKTKLSYYTASSQFLEEPENHEV